LSTPSLKAAEPVRTLPKFPKPAEIELPTAPTGVEEMSGSPMTGIPPSGDLDQLNTSPLAGANVAEEEEVIDTDKMTEKDRKAFLLEQHVTANNLLTMDKVEEAMQIIDDLVKDGFFPTIKTYTKLFKALGWRSLEEYNRNRKMRVLELSLYILTIC
jgi:hypothetical protein